MNTRSYSLVFVLTLGGLLCLTATGQPLTRLANTSLRMPQEQPASTAGYATENAFPTLSFAYPIYFAVPPGETSRLFVCEQGGRIILIPNLSNPSRTVFLDISSRITGGNPGSEAGLYALAFHPGYATNRYFYIYYTLNTTTGGGSGRHLRVARFRTSPTKPNQADPASEMPLVSQFAPSPYHIGGSLEFGADGCLYWSVGDNGGEFDNAFFNSQRIDKNFFSGMFRFDVDQRAGNPSPNPHPSVHAGAYKVPADNPWVGATSFHGVALDRTKVRTEFFAVGLRNPFRFSFDRPTGRLYCGDVGQYNWEEIDVIEKGKNYGWAYWEGRHATPRTSSAPSGFVHTPPILEYAHGSGTSQGNVVIGGRVYRGTRLPGLVGAYIFADNASGNVWATRYDGIRANGFDRLTFDAGLVAFGEDPRNGDLLMADIVEGKVKRLVGSGGGSSNSAPPQNLSQTGVFSDLVNLTPNPGIVPYDLNVPFWSDNAIKTRWFSVPSLSQKIGFNPEGNWTFPTGTVWIKHFELELTHGVASSRRRLETRLLLKTTAGVYGFTYRWGSSSTDATLVAEEGMDETFSISEGSTVRTQVWHYPSRSECLTCHTPVGGHGLGFNTWQLNRNFNYPGGAANQLRALSDAGYFSSPVGEVSTLRKLAPANDPSASLEHRFRSYLAANCVQCHQPGGAGGGFWDARITTPLASANLINGLLRDDGGDSQNRVIKPGDPIHSMLLTRISSPAPRRMPPLATSVFDSRDMELVSAYILSAADRRVTAVVKLPLNENGGSTTANLGSAGGSLNLSPTWPSWTGNIPNGVGGVSAIDFGTTPGNFVVESAAALTELAGLPAFTISGWINNRSATTGVGGNRVVSCINNGADGFDLVLLADGSLQLGVNQWPDTSPARSSAGKISTDASAGEGNWRFFAVTYSAAAQQVDFYFGSNSAEATLDVTRSYTGRGSVGAALGRLALGHFNSATRASALDRMLRGVLDQVQIYPDELTASEIVLVQRTGSPVAPPAAPAQLMATADDGRVNLSWNSVSNAVRYLVRRSTASGTGYVPVATNVISTSYTDTGLINGTPYFYVVSAANSVGESPPSAEASAIPQLLPPPAPNGLVASAGNGRITLTWNPAVRATGYNVKSSTNSGGGYSLIAANVAQTTFSHTNLINGVSYYYVVSALNSEGESLDSSSASATPQATPPPIVELSFEEGSGTTLANTGTAGGTFARTAPTPAFSANVPPGVGGSSAMDYGTTTGNFVVESPTPLAGLGALNAFTICGWVNARAGTEGPGGNRLVSWINNGGDGVDLVFRSDGSLQLGIDEWPDGSPARSSAAKISTDAGASAGNWRFLAVSYEATAAQVKFYFGSSAADASLDVTRTYPGRGAVGTAIGRLAVGHFNSATRSTALNRMFRGLIDEVQIHGTALTLEEIIAVQRTTPGPPTSVPPAPTGLAAVAGNAQVSVSWNAVGGASSYNLKRSTTSGSGYVVITSDLTSPAYTDTGLNNGTTYYYVVSAVNALGEGNQSIQAGATPQALPAPLVKLSFDETSGTATANAGSAGGTFSLTLPVPSRSGNVPVAGGVRSIDFGATPGNYGIDSAGPMSALGGLASFTICGWLNCRSAAEGPGGNRVVSWINNGGDGVDLVFRGDGSLQLGVDEWPDASPARSSAAKISTHATAGASNWRFFAVTYEAAAGEAKFYFGSGTTDAALDATRSYPGRGAVGTAVGRLTIGHFNPATRSTALNRMFRGLIDEVHIFGSKLALPEIIALQGRSGAGSALPGDSEPLVHLALNETSGLSTANAGSLGGTLTLTTPTPTRSANVPGVGGPRSVDFGVSFGNFGVDSAAPLSGLGGLDSFTICGWVNCRSATEGAGGNRLVTWINNGGDGVDLVYHGDGSLQIGVDQWPDSSPARSSAGKIPADPTASAANWRFFAVSYDGGLAETKFYFGSTAADAVLDVSRNYPGRGPVGTAIGRLSIGHFNSATRPIALDRMFRGLIDDVRVFASPLSLADIIAAQHGGAAVAPSPRLATVGNDTTSVWRITDIAHLNDGVVRLRIAGPAGQTCRILASEDLVEWTDLGTEETDENGTIEFIDAGVEGVPHCFYRVMVP